MYFRDIVGQTSAKNELRGSFMAGVVPHARLFVGEDGAGALGLAYAYARYINCAQPTEHDACGRCRSCLRMDEYAAQDLLFLFPIVNVGSRNLCIDELPTWRKYLALGAHSKYSEWTDLLGGDAKRPMIFAREGESLMAQLSYQIAEARYRTLIVWLPERMHETLANKLLKLTEEPPEHTLILMVTQSESEVLGTLRSRMQSLHLRPLSEVEIVEALRRHPDYRPEASPEESAHLSGGNYRVALDHYLGRSASEEATTKLMGRILRATVNARPMEIRTLADELAKLSREDQLALIGYMGHMFREIYIHPYGVEALGYLQPAERGIAKYLSGCLTETNTLTIHEELNLATVHIAQNVNGRMVWFDLILRLTSTLAPAFRAHGIR